MIAHAWRAEPILLALITNGAFWPTLFWFAGYIGHPIPEAQQHQILVLAAIITSGILRQTVTAPDTNAKQIADIQSAQTKG